MNDTDIKTPPPQKNQTSEMPSHFLYENEHPQVQMRFSAKLGDRRVQGRSLSVIWAEVDGLLPPDLEDSIAHVTLQFDFIGFSVSLFAEARIELSGDAADARARLHFTEPTGAHLAPLRYIINSTIAGDMVSINGMMGYTGPLQVKKGAAKAERTFGEKLGKTLRTGAVAALSLGLIALAANVLYERVVFSYEARPVQLVQQGQTLRATSAGQITFVNDAATTDEVVYSVSANTGDFLSTRMPCNCDIAPTADFFEGATVLTGTPLLRLIAPDAPLLAEAEISYEGISKLLEGDSAELVFSSGTILPVTVDLSDTSATNAAGATLMAQLTLPATLPTEIGSGDTARLRFKRDVLPMGLGEAITSITSISTSPQ